MQLIADEVEEQGPDAVEDLAVEAAEEKWDPAVTNLETVQAVKKLRRSKINQPILLEAVVQTEDTVPDLSAELEAADSKINVKSGDRDDERDVGEVAAADLEAVVWAAVDLVEVAEEDSEEAAGAVFVEAVAVSVEATVEVIEVDEAVVGEVVAEAVEVTLMVKAARKLQNQKFKLQEQKNHFHEKNKKY